MNFHELKELSNLSYLFCRFICTIQRGNTDNQHKMDKGDKNVAFDVLGTSTIVEIIQVIEQL